MNALCICSDGISSGQHPPVGAVSPASVQWLQYHAEVRTYHLCKLTMLCVHLPSTGYLVSTDRYSVLEYLVLISTTLSTNMYLVSEIYLIRKTDINVTKLVP